MRAVLRAVAGAAAIAALVAVPSHAAFDPVVEASNYSKTQERQALYQSPQGELLLRQVSTANQNAATMAQLNDPEREFSSDLCWNGSDGCAGDARLYNWQAKGYGIVKPVLFTARDGATLSGHVWATKAGPAHRPGIVITNGSVQANEQMYWYAAQALAKAGYVVLTWDPQGQGQSDTRGETPDENEGFPAQTDGRPFFDGTEDALDFFFSTPSKPYVPVTSCSSGTSHAPKQARRVKAGLDAGYNPFWSLFDHKRVGLAGHSYGAAGVSYIGQFDPRVDAIVAWDNLSQPSSGSAGTQSFPPGEAGCPAHPEDRSDLSKSLVHGKGKPALGMSADYFLPPEPNTSEPRTPQQCQAIQDAYDTNGTKPTEAEGLDCKSFVSNEYSRNGVDSGEIVIRGGSHLDFSFISNPAFGATLRGADLIDWYTTAWFDKYVKGDKTADARLLTNRWRHDGDEAQVDPGNDGNMFSFYHRSRLDFTLANGKKYDCEDLRTGCAGLSDDDGYKGDYSYIALATSPDGSAAPGAPGGAGLYGSSATRKPAKQACASKRRAVVHIGAVKGTALVRAVARAGKRVLGRTQSRRLTIDLRGLPRGRYTVRIRVTLRQDGRLRHITLTHRYRTCTPGRHRPVRH
ncbi:MAG: alpha/beta hydrolase [Solirubrobacteraceae bacterium]|nr:alpha/beta hydrolase [Solirubrobacteraceae bacterium]